MNRSFIRTAALLGAIAVILGAFAAHGLKKLLTNEDLQIFETAVRYQFYHVFALLAVGIVSKDMPGSSLLWAGRLFITGIAIFSGSLYLLCYVRYSGLSMNWLGAITPLGGVAFILGWLLLFAAFVKRN